LSIFPSHAELAGVPPAVSRGLTARVDFSPQECERPVVVEFAHLFVRKTMWSLLTVYFGTPNMFNTLWFGFVYGTNPPLGTLII
jgi:hypothetical protein